MPALPSRDPEARARLREVAGQGKPVTLARERTLEVGGPLGELLPGGVLQRGTVLAVEGAREQGPRRSPSRWPRPSPPRGSGPRPSTSTARSASRPRSRPGWRWSASPSCAVCHPTAGRPSWPRSSMASRSCSPRCRATCASATRAGSRRAPVSAGRCWSRCRRRARTGSATRRCGSRLRVVVGLVSSPAPGCSRSALST